MKQQCIAHRGKHDVYFENTKEAFIEASKSDFYGIETDIHLTKDLRWVCHHNDDIISDGKNYFIKDYNFCQLMARHLDNDQGHENATVCPFEDYLEICKQSGKRPIIEIKGSPKWKHVKQMAKFVDAYMGISNVTFIGFYPLPILRLKLKYGKKLDAEYLIQYHHEFFFLAKLIGVGVDVEINELTLKNVKSIHKKKKMVNVWTIDSQEALNRAFELGVDQITTDVFDQNS